MSAVAPTILDFERIILNLISYFFTVCKAISTGDDISFLLILLHLEFTLNFSTIFVGSFNIRASREAYPTEVRSHEIGLEKIKDKVLLFPRKDIVESALYVKKKWGTIYGA